ncbi:unnamed protein product [Caenorhabditis auriculariae]|uniref:Tumor protein p53-inducible protein 11 n=1 Tax=Caenorhabditis auriculariae TaxID=2777116 RepID=A0A8S1H2I5_9PELO|nr:unnamed protein product [Caenorhabditis auriculariae]
MLEGGSPVPRRKPRLTEESRKQSASDLQSRLKTRKLLGVGELARNGDVYRSKISQLLGINESLYVRLPRGLMYWNTVNTLYFYMTGFLCIVLPRAGIRIDYGVSVTSDQSLALIRLYGAVLLSYGLLFRSILLQRETRAEIATLLLVTAILHSLQTAVSIIAGMASPLNIALHLGIIIGNLCYHTFVDGQGGLHRQVFRIIEDYSLISNSPIVEKKPLVDLIIPTDSHTKCE